MNNAGPFVPGIDGPPLMSGATGLADASVEVGLLATGMDGPGGHSVRIKHNS